MLRSKFPRDIFNEIKWRFDLKNCTVYYIHRGAPGNIRTIAGSEIKSIDRAFLVISGYEEDVYIPYHRIVKIEFDGSIVFLKK